ncbi:MAG: ComEC family competence protein [Treponema sp.]|jgi:competence protein ComEC|nr:ComEC family competence protein [Treponema sp.]
MKNHLRITPLLCAAIAVCFGFYFLPSTLRIAFLILALVALCLLRVLTSIYNESRLLKTMAFCSVAFACGLMLGITAAAASRSEISFSLAPERVTAIEGVLLEDPRIISSGNAIASVGLRRCASEGGLRVSSKGELTVFFPHDNAMKLREFGRGTAVFAEGKLRSTDMGWTFSAASMHVVKTASSIERMRTGIRLSLINRFEGKVWGGLALALLLGIKDNLDSNLSIMYRNAGCSYILALSGMHLAVLAAIIAFLLRKPLGLKAATIAGAAIICLYCFIVGPMPSLNRSALMYLLGAAAIIGFLPRNPLSILCLSFLIQIVVTPAAGNSISFILSYLALAGILVITPLLYSIFAGKVPDFLLQPLTASCGAFLATAGITGSAFGIIVPMGIVTGLALVPLTTFFIIGSLAWLAIDFLPVSISGILGFPLTYLYKLMEGIVSAAGRIGGIPAKSGMAFFILALSLFLTFAIAVFERRQQKTRLKLLPFS